MVLNPFKLLRVQRFLLAKVTPSSMFCRVPYDFGKNLGWDLKVAERTFLLLLFLKMETKDTLRWKIGWSALGMLTKYVISSPTLQCFADKLLGKAFWFAETWEVQYLFKGWTRPFEIGYFFSQKLMYVLYNIRNTASFTNDIF